MPDAYTHNETELLKGVANGEERAFLELVNRYSPLLFNYIARLTGDAHLAEELVQDTFLKIWLTREHLYAVQNFRAYLFVVSKNHALKALEKALRNKLRHTEWERQEQAATTPEQDREGIFLLIDAAIAQLPPQQLKVWTMSRRQGLKYAEIARELGLSRETVKKYLQFAHASIQKYVTQHLPLLLLAVAGHFF